MKTDNSIKRIVREFILRNEITVPINLNHITKIVNAILVNYKLPHNVGGNTLKVKKGRIKSNNTTEYIIIINTLQTDTRKRFTIAHEIGHIVLKHHEKMALYNLNGDEINLHEVTKKIDREADIFAAELLMPTSHVERLIENDIKDIEVLSEYYNVSKSAMGIKVKEFLKLGRN